MARDVERISAEDSLAAINEADTVSLDWSFLCTLRDVGRAAAETWLSQARRDDQPVQGIGGETLPSPEAQSASSPSRYVG